MSVPHWPGRAGEDLVEPDKEAVATHETHRQERPDAKGKDGEGQKFPCPRRRGGCGRFGLALLRHLPKQELWLASCAMPRGDGAISKLTVIIANFVRPEKRPGTAIWAF